MYPLALLLAAAPGADPVVVYPGSPPSIPPICPTVPATPTWDRMFVGAGDCAGPALQPFQKQPRVRPVKVCPGEPNGDGEKNVAWVKEFHTPASIPYPRFDLDGRPVDGDGLIIYEGMRFAVDPKTGKYDLTFTATVPGMPVTLRLQLRLTHPNDPQQTYTLTLPAIRMEPPRDRIPGDPEPLTFHIAHRGYSSLLRDPNLAPADDLGKAICDPPPHITCKWIVTRTGTARFGTPFAIEVNR